jgi:hypothetical protein
MIGLLSLLLAVPAALATYPYPKLSSCTIPENTLKLPKAATDVIGMPPAQPVYVGISIGTYNYTCDQATKTWTELGVYSVLVDVSCLVTATSFPSVQAESFSRWNNSPTSYKVPDYMADIAAQPSNTMYPVQLGVHYFVTDPSFGNSTYPAFDFTKFTGNASDKAVLVHTAEWSDGTVDDVPYLQVDKIYGGIASKIWRVSTFGGNPPTTPCSASDTDVLTVRYSGTYWFYP